MLTCAICECREGLAQLISRLGSSPICMECFECQAEKPVSIHEFLRTGNKPWKGMGKELRCWAGHEFGYMGLRDYERHISRNMPTIKKPDPVRLSPEEEEGLANVMEAWRAMGPLREPPSRRARRFMAAARRMFTYAP